MNHAIVLAAGEGKRFKSKEDKLLLTVAGHPLIYYTLIAFNDHPEIDSITLVANKANKAPLEDIIKTYRLKKVKKVIVGGSTRQKSFAISFKSLQKIAKKSDIVLAHNGANPLPSAEEISKVIANSQEQGACIVGHFVTSTIKEIDDQHIIKTHDRKKLFAAQTPQAAQYQVFEKALKNPEKIEVTDEAMLLEAINQHISYVEASADNFKITTHADYQRLKTILGDVPKDYRVGIGQDSHVFDEAERLPRLRGAFWAACPVYGEQNVSKANTLSPCLVLGGLILPEHPKLQANSDGDVILHAIFNALSQAIGGNSLGFYADAMCEKGVKDSKKYLEPLLKKLKKEKLKINSLGLMIECKTPKIDPLVTQLKKSLAKILDLDARRIGITATSGENLTAFGNGLGIQCFAIVSLKK